MEYKFKRDIYKEIKMSIVNNIVTFLFGPRKCGKTICMKQIHTDIGYSKYYDLKPMNIQQREDVISEIVDSIQNNKENIFLIDEVTYLDCPESALETIYNAMAMCNDTNTRVVLTGSQSVALKSWADKYFCGCAGYVYAEFMNYDEWLRYMTTMNDSISEQAEEASEESYVKFLYNIDKFYKMPNIKDYLEGCLDETVISNQNAVNIIFNNDSSDLTADFLLDVLYSILICLHNQVGKGIFEEKEHFRKELKYMVDNTKITKDIENQIDMLLQQRYSSFKGCNEIQLKKALLFLYNCGLISFTTTGEALEEWNIANKLLNDCINPGRDTRYKEDFFKTYNIFIKYPMFYVGLIKYAINDVQMKQLSRRLLGSIVECHVRGLLPQKGQYEFRKPDDNNIMHEIDYVNPALALAVEITVQKKHNNSFYMLREIENRKPEHERIKYKFVMLTLDEEKTIGDTEYIPYFKYIQLLSSENNPYKLCT